MVLMLLAASPLRAQSLKDLTKHGEGVYAPDAEECKGAALAGASKVFVVVRSNAEVLLVGARGDGVVWKKKFPLRREVNTPKTYPSCEARKIELYSQFPFSAGAVVQTFSWDGRALRFVSSRTEDPSAEFMEKAIAAAEAGDARTIESMFGETEEGEVDMLYPGMYINGPALGEAIKRGQASALAQFKTGGPHEAARRLALMFDVTVELAAFVASGPSTKQAPERWLTTWKEIEVDTAVYAPALNDYGFYLQETGEHATAVAVFEAVVEREARLAVARLNLADSLWALGRKPEARAHYKAYRELMTAENKAARIPARVGERLR